MGQNGAGFLGISAERMVNAAHHGNRGRSEAGGMYGVRKIVVVATLISHYRPFEAIAFWHVNRDIRELYRSIMPS